jgi:hypothetical protein
MCAMCVCVALLPLGYDRCVRWWIAVVVAGCGRIGFDTRAGEVEATDCTPLALSDDFAGTTASSQWFPFDDSGVTVAQTGGALVVTLASGAGNAHYGGYASSADVDLRDHCMFVTIVATPATGPAEMQFTVRTGSQYAGLTINDAKLVAFTQASDGTNTDLSSVPHDATAHHVLRVREAGGTTFYESSPDGVAFDVQASEPTPFDFSAVTVVLDAGTYAALANPGSAVFDDFDR